MSELVIFKGDTAFTSTIAIAEGVESQHKNVIELVRRYRSDLDEFGVVTFEMLLSDNSAFETRNSKGRPTEYALLNEQQATLILTYLKNTEIVRTFKKRLVKAFYELVHKVNQPLNPANMSRIQLLELAMQAEQERLALEHKVEEMQPKVEALDRIASANGSLCITDTAKSLQMKPSVLFKWLNEQGWIYRRVGGTAWIGYSEKITVGYLEHKVTVIHRDDGSEKVINQVLITPKGLIRLSQVFNSKQDAA